ncbi:MAG: porin [Pseudomonadota bacterium]
MKKQLLCTSAIALGVAVASPVAAQEWNVGLGGYYVLHMGFGDYGGSSGVLNPNAAAVGAGALQGDFDGFQMFQDAEVHVIPQITLDNGMTFGANIQFETADGSDMDEVYIQVSSDTFGTLQLGYENSVGAQSMVAAPNVTLMPINSGSTSGFTPLTGSGFGSGSGGGFAFLDASRSAYTEVWGGYGNSDVARINYFTPSFNGFTLGLSYAADNVGSDGAFGNPNNNTPGVLSDIWDIGVNYSQTFGTTDVAIGARYGQGSAASGSFLTAAVATGGPGSLIGAGTGIVTGAFVPVTSDPSTWAIGGSVTFNGVTVGGHYAENDNGGEAGLLDTSGWGFGVAYDMPGPWSVSFTTFQSEVDGTGTITTGPAAGTTFSGNHDLETYIIGASRNLGPGVDWGLWIFYEDYSSDAGSPLAGNDIDSTVVGTSISLSF